MKCYVEGMVGSVPWGKGDCERLVIIVLCISNMFGCRPEQENWAIGGPYFFVLIVIQIGCMDFL